MFLSPHKSDNSQPTKQLSHSKSHNKQLLQEMMSDLQQQVQDCVREVFHLTSLSLQQTKYQITFYQQIASRLVNVTVELQSALGEVNNVIEKVDTINKSNNKDKSNKSNKSNKREKKLQSVEHKGSPTSITEFNIDKDNTFNIDKDNTNNDSPTKLTIVVDDSINSSNSKVQLISPFKKEQDKQSPLKEQDNRKQVQLQKTVNNPQMSIPTLEQQQSSSNQQSNSNKNNNQFQLSLTNDNLYKQYQQLLYTYHQDRHSLNHQNQILLNQWLQTHTHNLSSMSINTNNNTINNNNNTINNNNNTINNNNNTINNNNSNNNNNSINSNNTIINSNSNNNFYTIARTLIQQLSKYQSVSEHIHNIQSIEHNKLINQLKSTNNLYADNNDQQKKWIKHVTKSYLLNMAQLMHSHLSENQQIMQIYQQLNNYQHQQQQDLDHMR